MNCETARDMWMEQDAVYEQKSHSLQQRFYSFNKGEEDSICSNYEIQFSNQVISEKSHFNSSQESTQADEKLWNSLTSRLVMEELRLESNSSWQAHQGKSCGKRGIYRKIVEIARSSYLRTSSIVTLKKFHAPKLPTIPPYIHTIVIQHSNMQILFQIFGHIRNI